MRLLNLILTVGALCPDYELSTSCAKQCSSLQDECWLNCDGDTLCDYQCSRDGFECIDSCPCFSQCPNGCDGCLNTVCVCAIPDENPDYIICSELAELDYLKCVVKCPPADVECLSLCIRDYNTLIDQCPCQVR